MAARCWLVSLLLPIVLLQSPILATAQESATPQSQTSATDIGPTLAETAAWIESEGVLLMQGGWLKLDREYLILSQGKFTARDLKLQDCILSWTTDYSSSISSATQPEEKEASSFAASVTLKDLDTGGISVQSDTIMGDKPSYYFNLRYRSIRGAPTSMTSEGERNQNDTIATTYVRNPDDGQRLVNAIRRAAILCGASPSPF